MRHSSSKVERGRRLAHRGGNRGGTMVGIRGGIWGGIRPAERRVKGQKKACDLPCTCFHSDFLNKLKFQIFTC